MLRIMGARDKARLRSCGGQTAGHLFTSRNHANDDAMSLDDDTMAGAVRWRLGSLQYGGQGRRCKLAAAGKQGEAVAEVQERALRGECGTTMDAYGDHPQVCCLGAGFKLRHDPIVELLGHALRELGCLSRVECSMLGVFRKKGKTIAPGRLDVYAVGQAGLMEVLIDVAVKHPCTEALLAHAAERDGHAAKIAEDEKLREYFVPAGKKLTPFGVETFGRLGCAAEELLAKMQAVAANRSRLRGGHANRIVERLRERIDAHLHRHAVQMCIFAEHGLQGTAPYRKVPMSAEQVMGAIRPMMLRDTPALEAPYCPHSNEEVRAYIADADSVQDAAAAQCRTVETGAEQSSRQLHAFSPTERNGERAEAGGKVSKASGTSTHQGCQEGTNEKAWSEGNGRCAHLTVQDETGAAWEGKAVATMAANMEATTAATTAVATVEEAAVGSLGGAEPACDGAELAAIAAGWNDAEIERCIIQAHYAHAGYEACEEISWLHVPDDWPQGTVLPLLGVNVAAGPVVAGAADGDAAAVDNEVCQTAPAIGASPRGQRGQWCPGGAHTPTEHYTDAEDGDDEAFSAASQGSGVVQPGTAVEVCRGGLQCKRAIWNE